MSCALQITQCTPYPFLKSANGQCIPLPHVDDVLCLSHRSCLDGVLALQLKSRYKISLDMPGDELSFLKRQRMMLNKQNWQSRAIPILDRLFERLKINKGLNPKSILGHPLLDEFDNSAVLDQEKCKVYRFAVGLCSMWPATLWTASMLFVLYPSCYLPAEVFSDSDRARHRRRTARKPVCSWHVTTCLAISCALYSCSRSQKALA